MNEKQKNLGKKKEIPDRKYLLKNQIKVALMSRILAKGIDLFIVALISMLFYPVGVVLGFCYMVVSDYIQNGQSVGKRFFGFSVVSMEDGAPCSIKQSCVRNLPFLIPIFFLIVPFWGWGLSFFIGTPLVLLELYLLVRLDSGNRLGDVMADTTVIANTPAVEATDNHSLFSSAK